MGYTIRITKYSDNTFEVHNVGGSTFPGNNITGTCAIGGVWYTGNTFPAEFKNTYFAADLTYPGWIKSFTFDSNQQPQSYKNFLSNVDNISGLAYDPVNDAIYYARNSSGKVHKVIYNPNSNFPPVASFEFTPKFGSSPLSVEFDATPSSDPEAGALTYTWNFGDGTSDTGVNPTHVFTASSPVKFDVKLTVTDPLGASNFIYHTI